MNKLYDMFITLNNDRVIQTNEIPVSKDDVVEAVEFLLKPRIMGDNIKKFEIVLHEEN